MTAKEELGSEEPMKSLAGFQDVVVETKDRSKTESEENSDGSGQNSPRGVLETPISSVHSDGGSCTDTSSLERTTTPDGTVLESHISQWRSLLGGLLLRKKRRIMRLSTFPQAMRGFVLERKNSVSSPVGEELSRDGQADLEIPMRRPSWRNFNYQELAAATNNFSHDNLIGKGGHAEVYKGCLSDGQLVAIKRLTKKDKEEERIGDFYLNLESLPMLITQMQPNYLVSVLREACTWYFSSLHMEVWLPCFMVLRRVSTGRLGLKLLWE
ncbi:hypothetical protein HPP92_016093 [Vanilla planifolia]|uniref:Uncharacterized protein n=1 Tax=Vanilla planifolia TaxID=51239 RepID=A0A835URQ9_VANPL|nr:hypothetical protein HPP92_016093 [Vanilla planifolia]